MRPNDRPSAALAAAARRARRRRVRRGSDKAGGESKPDATVLTFANGNDDARSLEPFAAAVERLSGGSLRIEFKNAWRGGSRTTRTASSATSGRRQGRPRLGGIAGLRRRRRAVVRRAARAAADRQLSAPAQGAREPARRGDARRARAARPRRHRHPPRSDAQAARRRAPRAPRGLSTARRSRSSARRWPSRRCARSAHAPSEIPSAGDIDALRRHRAAGRLDRRQRVRQGRHLPRRQREPVAAPGRRCSPTARRSTGSTTASAARLRDAARAALPATSAQEQADDEEGAAILCRSGAKFVTAGDADLVALRRAVQPVYDWLERHAQTKAAIGQIRAMRSESHHPRPRPSAPRRAGARPDGHADRRRLPLGHHARAAQQHAGLRPGREQPEQRRALPHGAARRTLPHQRLVRRRRPGGQLLARRRRADVPLERRGRFSYSGTCTAAC